MGAYIMDNRYKGGRWATGLDSFFAKTKPRIILEPKKTALLIVDVQKGFCLPQSSTLQELRKTAPGDYDYFCERLKSVVPNLQKLQCFFRENDLEVIQCVVSSLTADGRDRLFPDKTLGIHFAPNSVEAEILDEIKPEPDELVFKKTTASLFTPYGTYHVLRSMGIEHLVFAGCVTDGCVESTVRGGFDLFGFANVVVEDCCAAFDEESHVAAIRAMGSCFAEIASAEAVIDHLSEQLRSGGT